MSFPPNNRIKYDFNRGVELGSGPSDGAHYRLAAKSSNYSFHNLIDPKPV